MSRKDTIKKIIKQIMQFLIFLTTEVLKTLWIEGRRLYNTLLEKLRFSLTFKITLAYAHKTFSILLFLSLFIIGGFVVYNGWTAQEYMKRDYNLVSHYLEKVTGEVEGEIKRLAELDNLSITVFDKEGKVLYTTESDTTPMVFYNEKNQTDFWNLNDNYILVRDYSPIKFDLSSSFDYGSYNFGYAMVLREEVQWKAMDAQLQIKNRLPRESVSVIILGIVLFGINSLLILSVISGGARSSRRILRPIEVMTKTVENITINELDTRLDVRGSQDELKDLARTFNSMLDRIQQSYEQQNQFVSDASHELRTPISVIQGYASLLDRWGKNDAQVLEESITAIKTESENMKDLVEKLLFLARGDKNTQRIEREDFYLNELIDEIIKETKMIDESHEICSEKNETILINADRRLIKEAIRVFVDNSIKYTPEGGKIKIDSFLRERSAQVSIEDTGVGISKEDLPHIFNRFYRADKSRTRVTGGTGLGLAIAKWIIERHNGKVSVQSEISVGTRVTIKLETGTEKKPG
jgi:two-component system, OmpR family, sensor histidine kinase ArlS